MAVNRREIFTDVTKRIQQFPGPYVGYVKNSGDINRMGRLFVFIPSLHGEYDEIGKQQENQLIPVSYCSPFAGQTPLSDTTEGQKQFSNTQKSYGFWMVPPDIDTKVLVMFADGHVDDYEAALMRKIIGLFHLTGKDSAKAKENALASINNQS